MTRHQLLHGPPSSDVPASNEPAVQVDSLVKSYAGARVVDNVSFSVRHGEILGVLGANGAGKTTTVECLQGLRRPDSGSLRVLGVDPCTDPARLRTVVGSQLQEADLPDRLRVGEAISLFGAVTQDHIDVEAVLRPWGLLAHRNTAFGDLSGGGRQRLFIALALLHRPRVLLLDELTRGLDPSARRDVWEVIRSVRDQGTTVIVVSHFADEVEELCDRVIVMGGGQVVQRGTPADLTRRFGGPTRISFTPPPQWTLESLPQDPRITEVIPAAQSPDQRVHVVTGAEMIPAICASTLTGGAMGPTDLQVSHPRMHEAMLNVIGEMS
ncbi:MAG: ABC transporter ATP-binding protein [Ornithinimicrobium sp.]